MIKKRFISMLVLLVAVATGAWAQDPTYIVAGNYAEIFEIPWYGTYEANKMTKGGDGKYTKTYNVEDAFSDIQLKVVKDGVDWIGDKTGNNVTFSMKQAGSFTVTLDPNANPVCVTVTGDNVVFANTEYAINYATGMQNGTVTGPDTAKEDDEVTLTITPAAGYVLESISVTGVTTENAVEVTDGKFTMPAEDVNVIATFKLVTYAITLAEGTEDATSWTIAPAEATTTGVAAGTTVTATYNGTKKVKSVKAKKKATAAPAVIDLSMVDCAGTARSDGQWTANCYMVHTAGDYKLPLVYGNAIKAGETNAAAYTGVTGNSNATATFPRHDGEAITAPWIKDNGITVTQAELLWQDAQGLITAVGIDGDYLTLTVGTDAATQEGNALVAAKTADGNVVWSWHIWVTKQTFAAADLTTVATGSHDYKVTPVNLGWVGDDIYTGTNTFYQWGRKDPFRGMGDVTFDGTTAATIADNIKNPATFYKVSSKPSNTTYYNMWDAQQTGTDNITTATVKTVYDPSPAGFCVPTGNLYYYMKNGSGVSFGWDGTNKGRNLTSVTPNVFFPASGYRNGSGGGLNSVGYYGYSWSASAYGSNTSYARYLFFSPNSWNFSNYDRSEGYPVRAVAE